MLGVSQARGGAMGIAMLLLAAGAVSAKLPIGATAPGFTLKDLAGTSHSLAAHQNQAAAVVLVWVSPTCPMVHIYERRIQALYEALRDKGVPMYGISSDKDVTVANWREHQRELRLDYPVLLDPHNRVADAYQVVCNSEVFVLDTKLKLRYHGAIDDNCRHADKVQRRYAWEAALALLAGRDPNPAETVARGCAIEREDN